MKKLKYYTKQELLLLLSKATEFVVYQSERHTVTISSIDGKNWKICHRGDCYDWREKRFVHEPMPSLRTASFLAYTRFDTLEAALEVSNEAVFQIISKEGSGVTQPADVI